MAKHGKKYTAAAARKWIHATYYDPQAAMAFGQRHYHHQV